MENTLCELNEGDKFKISDARLKRIPGKIHPNGFMRFADWEVQFQPNDTGLSGKVIGLFHDEHYSGVCDQSAICPVYQAGKCKYEWEKDQ
ncbi:MAG: hypothetical protein FWE31_00330 [Firmicutes bacterium]|nr:hypothetical protein [Bacillota bacterium]